MLNLNGILSFKLLRQGLHSSKTINVELYHTTKKGIICFAVFTTSLLWNRHAYSLQGQFIYGKFARC